MRRRRLIEIAGVASFVGVAGCANTTPTPPEDQGQDTDKSTPSGGRNGDRSDRDEDQITDEDQPTDENQTTDEDSTTDAVGDGSDGDTPEATVKAYFDAVDSGDAQRVNTQLHPNSTFYPVDERMYADTNVTIHQVTEVSADQVPQYFDRVQQFNSTLIERSFRQQMGTVPDEYELVYANVSINGRQQKVVQRAIKTDDGFRLLK
jgi:hypothetical protein